MKPPEIRNVLVCGAGTMGSWITLEVAAADIHVICYDPDEAAIQRARDALERQSPQVRERVLYTVVLDDSAHDVDLALDCVPENPAIKSALFQQLDARCPARTILASNTSVLLPSQFLGDVTRRDRFACLHFYVPQSAVEIMPLRETSEATIRALRRFAHRLGELPITLRKESPGYLVSAMVGAAVDVALDLVARGITSHEDVDRAWMAVTRMRSGPVATLDTIGLDTSVAIRRERLRRDSNNDRLKFGLALLEQMVDDGRLGIKSGRGFYSYPNPAFADPDFLSPRED